MPKTIIIPNGFLTVVETDFKCPECNQGYTEEDYYNRLSKSKKFYIYKTCKGCSAKLGISSDIKGDVVVWLAKDELKQKMILA